MFIHTTLTFSKVCNTIHFVLIRLLVSEEGCRPLHLHSHLNKTVRRNFLHAAGRRCIVQIKEGYQDTGLLCHQYTNEELVLQILLVGRLQAALYFLACAKMAPLGILRLAIARGMCLLHR